MQDQQNTEPQFTSPEGYDRKTPPVIKQSMSGYYYDASEGARAYLRAEGAVECKYCHQFPVMIAEDLTDKNRPLNVHESIKTLYRVECQCKTTPHATQPEDVDKWWRLLTFEQSEQDAANVLIDGYNQAKENGDVRTKDTEYAKQNTSIFREG